jgi:hypothetical protein
MHTEKELLIGEIFAEIRNKFQRAKTVLELIKAGKRVPSEFINKALKDLEKIEEIQISYRGRCF